MSIKDSIFKTLIKLFNFFPLKNNKVFFFSYYGSQYGDNPKYISKKLIEKYGADRFKVIWAINDLNKYKNIDGVQFVRIMSLRYFYHLCTSKVIITNYRTNNLFIKRKEQYYIQTWHSSLRLKMIEGDVKEQLKPGYIKMAKEDSKKMDLLLSGCRYSTEIFKRSFWYDGEIFESGTPRSDVLIHKNKSLINSIKSGLNIDKDTKVLLYAPTFRDKESNDVYKIKFDEVVKSLKDKFGGEWKVLVRLHPHLINVSNEIITSRDIMDVTSYDDIQELLLITDVLITDYSSLMFDYGITRKPCFLYVKDYEKYISKERNLYFKLEELPFIAVKSEEELIEQIGKFNNENYSKSLNGFYKKVGSFEDGKSSERVADRIYDVCFKGE